MSKNDQIVLIRIENVSKSFGSSKVISRVNLDIRKGETVVLLGPSGSGKTTLLKLINGLERPDEGTIFFKDEPINTIAPHLLRRKMGYVIQDVGLFPHLTIAENIIMPVKVLNIAVKPALVNELLQLVGLEKGLASRYPTALSGGQQQRVGIARALANEPELVLMDEPFSALDNVTRRHLQEDFLKLDHLIAKTVILVTHDIHEAFKLGDRIVILDQGSIQQVDTPYNLLFHPKNAFVKHFLANDDLLLKLNTLQAADMGIDESQTLFELLKDPTSSQELKLRVMQRFFNLEKDE